MRRHRGETEEGRKVELWRSVWAFHPHPLLPIHQQAILLSHCPQVTCSLRLVSPACALWITVQSYINKYKMNFKIILKIVFVITAPKITII